ncbi:MAG: glycoside hydrolase family 88 protein [Planctomycetales bacterium]|nr:glycoside hydrolase family 88 protein [Planctomycetales bacterium]
MVSRSLAMGAAGWLLTWSVAAYGGEGRGGVTADYEPIRCTVPNDAWEIEAESRRIVVVGIDTAAAPIVEALRQRLSANVADELPAANLSVAFVPNARLAKPTGFPPTGDYYGQASDPAAAYLWRWIGVYGADLVVVIERGEQTTWRLPKSGEAKPDGQNAAPDWLANLAPEATSNLPNDHLAAALNREAACEVGTVPAISLTVGEGDTKEAVVNVAVRLLSSLAEEQLPPPSPARAEFGRRLKRTPTEVARQLSVHYGHDLNQVAYIPALALVGRLRLGELDNDASHAADVERIVQPYVTGQKPVRPKSGSELAGHLVFAELAKRAEGEQRGRLIELVRVAADQAFDEQGTPRDAMPFHNEMSDAVFMGGPILAAAGSLTGDSRFFEAALGNTRFMRRLVLRPDGIYRHSPLDETAWGRGNGFPALGLALMLSEWPEQAAGREELLTAFREHMTALLAHQDASGCWHQIVDREESYRELSCTCMISFAMQRGVRRGWLDAAPFEPAIERAWRAIKLRTPENGRLVDVCTGTGKQKDQAAYFNRTAILGRDARGGAMALMVSTELAGR